MAEMNIPDMVAHAVLSTRSDAIIASDRSGTIIFWNVGAERIFGYSAACAIGQSLDIIIPHNLRQRHWEGYRHVMETGNSRYGDGDVLAVPGLRKDGSRISLEFTVSLLRDEHGQLAGIAAVLRDVTQRFEEMRALRRKIAQRDAATG